MPTLRQDVERLQNGRDQLVRMRSRVEASEPPPGERPRGREWVPREILAHIDEMLPYWLGEVERVLAGGPDPVPFGRVATDPIRTMTVDRDRTLPVSELYARLDGAVERVVRRLIELDDRQAAKLGLHPKRGEMTVEQIVDAFLASHIEEHCEQLAKEIEKAPRA